MYAKVFEQIFDSSIADDYSVRHVFMDLLVLADDKGRVDMTTQAISRRTNVPHRIVKRAIERLMAPDAESRTAENDGRRLVPMDEHRSWGWVIVNYSRYRSLRDEDSRREYMADLMRRKRAIAKVAHSEQAGIDGVSQALAAVSHSKPPLAHTDTDTDTDTELTPPTPSLPVQQKSQQPSESTGAEVVRERPTQEVIQLAETVLGTMPPAGNLSEMVAMHGNARVKEALLLTERSRKRSLAYTAAILRRWVSEGKPEDVAGGDGASHAPKSEVEEWPVRQ